MTDKRFDGLAGIPPMPGPLGDDLHLRAVHAAMLHQAIPEGWTQDLAASGYIGKSVGLGLIAENGTRDGLRFFKCTDMGALYWESRGGSFRDFIHQCPPTDDMRYEAPAQPSMIR